jgi:alkanesulfonate monooxygenase SsuD/methylene tetrahydromethanopterin reductase-like flavin-dependent oxidoreductase (luciferase family)
LLDIFSGGHVNRGTGRGFDLAEFEVFGVPVEESTERFRGVMEIVVAARQNERLTYHGKYHRYENVEVLPKPSQRPHPPVWVAASSHRAVEWAAERGLAVLLDPHSTEGVIADKQRHYEQRIGSGYESVCNADRPIARLITVAETETEAKTIGECGAAFSARYVPQHAFAMFRQGQSFADPIDHYMNNVILYGTPEKIVDDLRRLEDEISLRYLFLSPFSERTFELFTEQVLPSFV